MRIPRNRERLRRWPKVGPLFLEGGVHVGLRSLEGRGETEDDSRRAGNEQGVCEDTDVGADLKRNRAPERRDGRSDFDNQEMQHPAGQRKAERSSQKRDQNTFREQLAQEPPTASAERQAHGNFFAAYRSTGEQQTRNICASDEQKQRDRRHGGGDKGPIHGLKRSEVIPARGNRHAGVALVLRMGSVQLRGEDLELRLRIG